MFQNQKVNYIDTFVEPCSVKLVLLRKIAYFVHETLNRLINQKDKINYFFIGYLN